jgi:hypothetical protein
MFGRLMPREGNFFELFNAHADKIAEGSRELAAMMTNFSELEIRAQHIDGASAPQTRSRTRRSRCCTRRSSRRSTATRSTC